jgi:hypothetical protein
MNFDPMVALCGTKHDGLFVASRNNLVLTSMRHLALYITHMRNTGLLHMLSLNAAGFGN